MNENYCKDVSDELINFIVPVMICGLEGTGNMKMLTKLRLFSRKELAAVKKACEPPVNTHVLREFLEHIYAECIRVDDMLKRGVWHDTQ